ncbi:MAG TPA: hypothetical protein VLH86_03520 [Patescibacteria group bacterium]|nr:hypothetical protein [Patescibacteria group bacterium]
MTQGPNFTISEEARLAHVPGHAALEDDVNPRNTADYVPRRAAVEADNDAPYSAAELAGSVASHATVEADDERRGSHRRDEDDEPVADPFLGRLVAHFDDEAGSDASADDDRDDKYTAKYTTDDETGDEAGTDAASDAELEEGEDAESQGDPLEDLLAPMRPIVREQITEPQIQAHGRRIRRDDEPTYGYFSPYSNAVGRRAGLDYRKAHEQAVELATDIAPEARTGFDNYVLGLEGTPPEGYDLTSGDETRNYFNGAAERSLKDLQAGFMPEDFRDAASLEQAINHMILGGFASLDLTYGGHRIVALETAANLLREATMSVEDFDPTHAGLGYLYDRATLLAAAQRYESPHWKYNRAGRGAGDHTAEMVGTCLSAAEDTIAILYAQGRNSLLASPEPDAAAV